MRPLACALVVALALAGCEKSAPQLDGVGPPIYFQELHLGSMANGAVVTERSGEFSLRYSAVFAVDGFADTSWWSPRGEQEQWMVLRLPAQSRVDRITLLQPNGRVGAKSVEIEAQSAEGEWLDIGSVDMTLDPGDRMLMPQQLETSMLRFTMRGSGMHPVSALTEIVIDGVETGKRQPVEWAGEWALNQRTVTFAARGAMIVGSVPLRRTAMRLTGRPRNGFVPFAWSMGNATGYGAMSASATGELSGWWSWDEPRPWDFGESWFGRRRGSGGTVTFDRRRFALDFLDRRKPSPFFELVTPDGHLDRSAEAAEAVGVIRRIVTANRDQQFRLIVWDLDEGAAARKRAQELDEWLNDGAELPNLEIGVAAGNMLELPPRNALSRAMYQRVDLVVTSPAAENAPPTVLR